MLALSIRQPFAELILRGVKKVEYRTRPTRIIGQRFYIYASKGKVWSHDLVAQSPPEWLVELARQVEMIGSEDQLPTGVIVGSAVISKCEALECEGRRHEGTEARRGDGGIEAASEDDSLLPSSLVPTSCLRASVPSSLQSMYRWHLTDIQRATRLRKPTRHPQPVWFKPF